MLKFGCPTIISSQVYYTVFVWSSFIHNKAILHKFGSLVCYTREWCIQMTLEKSRGVVKQTSHTFYTSLRRSSQSDQYKGISWSLFVGKAREKKACSKTPHNNKITYLIYYLIQNNTLSNHLFLYSHLKWETWRLFIMACISLFICLAALNLNQIRDRRAGSRA